MDAIHARGTFTSGTPVCPNPPTRLPPVFHAIENRYSSELISDRSIPFSSLRYVFTTIQER
ncbi:hypothetical protein [Nostoc sp. JL33]|uniref:hypothetical protein n=1 Tax=Nostoc sp. JL33 TaxID=2815396 RepID=UPI0025DFA2D7|nr:hypothetical protein [Nostoc sp. JL33]